MAGLDFKRKIENLPPGTGCGPVSGVIRLDIPSRLPYNPEIIRMRL
jgi:hypothetical protein